MHIGLDHPTGEIVAGIDGFLAVSHLEAEFTGESAHAGGHPEQGRNAVQAMATAVQNLYGIPGTMTVRRGSTRASLRAAAPRTSFPTRRGSSPKFGVRRPNSWST